MDCFLQNTSTDITMATAMVTAARTLTHTATATTVKLVGGPVVAVTEQLLGFKESITIGHVVSTCSCVEATMM